MYQSVCAQLFVVWKQNIFLKYVSPELFYVYLLLPFCVNNKVHPAMIQDGFPLGGNSSHSQHLSLIEGCFFVLIRKTMSHNRDPPRCSEISSLDDVSMSAHSNETHNCNCTIITPLWRKDIWGLFTESFLAH